jgi:transposase
MKKEKEIPEIINKSEAEIDSAITIIQNSNLPDGTKEFAIKCIKSAIWFPQFLQRKNISINRLLKIIFGKGKGRSEKKDSVENESSEKSDATVLSENEQPSVDTSKKTEDLLSTEPEEKPPGHGRMPHTIYKESITIPLTIPDLSRGCSCPNGCGGKVYDFPAGIIVRVQGQSMARVVKYTVEKLRCNLCHEIISAPIPPEIGEEKYDAAFKSSIVLQKYYVAVPFYRQEQFQRLLGFPLSDATQWDLVQDAAGCAYSVFDVLKKMAGNGRRVFNDDTRVLILEVQKRLHENKGADERRGMFTTGIISEYGEHLIALFLNGTKHAGENLSDLLMFRDPTKDPILQMCDALKHNIPKNFKTIVSHCLSHGFRKFEEMIDYFEEECLTVMKAISDIYAEDEKTKEMTDEERLLHHKKYSRPILAALALYMRKQKR